MNLHKALPDEERRKGRVVDADGRPVAGAAVVVDWSDAPMPETARLTNADGSFGIALPHGRFKLSAHAPGGASGTLEVAAPDDGEIVIRLSGAKRPD